MLDAISAELLSCVALNKGAMLCLFESSWFVATGYPVLGHSVSKHFRTASDA
ncbi:hypothetical protein AG1IA_07736 [Rhizoctonia solani AG-1 IA]|uniref:Uncharacterized protein n=1 Tax=Thanatephorus cucumeris (strain AG1-IA) TaxID=983506 RepID=L8WN60_THACA|nr:hypothetical protein AG1IA_07736 [Rhizoctonia solani AG-1 IA]